MAKKLLTIALLLCAAALPCACSGDKKDGGDADAAETGGDADAMTEDGDDDAGDAAADPGEEEEASSTIRLPVGGVAAVPAGAGGAFDLTISAGGAGEQYALVLFASHWASGGRYSFTASTGGSGSGGGAPSARGSDGVNDHACCEATNAHGAEAIAVGDGGRFIDWNGIAGALGGKRIPLWEERPDDPVPVVGETRQFTIQDKRRALHAIDARCEFVDGEIAVWFDTTSTPAVAVSNLAEIAALYAGTVMPRERVFFGEEPDYNGDGVTFLLFSPYVAQVATAYFYPCDLIENPALMAGCDYGNHAEMLYVAPPGELPAYMRTPMAMAETMAHETAHMIYFHRKFLLNDQPSGAENIYLNEGLAALAQDLTGMTGGNFFVMKEGLDSIEDFSAVDIMSDFGGYDLARDGVLRGASYLFLRYLYDQAGGDRADGGNAFTDGGGIAWLRGYVDSGDKGVVNVQGRMEGKPVNDLLFDFYTALILSNRGDSSAPISDNPLYNFLPTQADPVTDRTRGADMFGSFRGMASATGPEWAYIDNSDGAILSTGVQYLVVDAAAAGEIVLTLQVDPRAEPLLRLARLK